MDRLRSGMSNVGQRVSGVGSNLGQRMSGIGSNIGQRMSGVGSRVSGAVDSAGSGLMTMVYILMGLAVFVGSFMLLLWAFGSGEEKKSVPDSDEATPEAKKVEVEVEVSPVSMEEETSMIAEARKIHDSIASKIPPTTDKEARSAFIREQTPKTRTAYLMIRAMDNGSSDYWNAITEQRESLDYNKDGKVDDDDLFWWSK